MGSATRKTLYGMETRREVGYDSRDGWGFCFRQGTVGPKALGEEDRLGSSWGLGRETSQEDPRGRGEAGCGVGDGDLGEKPSLATAASGEGAESSLIVGCSGQAQLGTGLGGEGSIYYLVLSFQMESRQ